MILAVSLTKETDGQPMQDDWNIGCPQLFGFRTVTFFDLPSMGLELGIANTAVNRANLSRTNLKYLTTD